MAIYALEPIERPDLPPEIEYEVELDGQVYRLRYKWVTRQERWMLDILTQAGEPLLTGKFLNVGMPMGWRYVDARLPRGNLMLVDNDGSGQECGFEELGFRCQMMYLTADEVLSRTPGEAGIRPAFLGE